MSPFYDIKGEYKFDFSKNNNVSIKYYFDNKLQLSTGVKGKEIPWNDINLLKIFFRHPFYTFLIISLIHYQAVKLFFKKNKIYSKPEKSCNELTY